MRRRSPPSPRRRSRYLHFGEQPPATPPLTRLHMALPVGATPDLNMQISPDGRRLAYLGRGSDGVVRVYLRALDEIEALPLAGTDDAGTGSLFWSHDSRWLAFVNQGRLKKIEVSGSTCREIWTPPVFVAEHRPSGLSM